MERQSIENGLWEKNLYNFITKVYPKLISEFPALFQMIDTLQRSDETQLHIAAREALVNSVIHADFKEECCSILIVKKEKYISYSKPGLLRIPIEQIYQGGMSVPRNITFQKLFRFIGLGESAGSGYNKILEPSRSEGFKIPELSENQGMRITNLKLWIVKEKIISNHVEEKRHNLPKNQSIVYYAILNNIPALSKLCNLKESSVDNSLRELKKKKLVKFEGAPKDGGYFKI